MKTYIQQKGFAMLFTVLIVSIILSLAIGISNVTFKQNLLSSIAKDSQIAFFAADAGMECGLMNDFMYSSAYYPRWATDTTVNPTLAIPCGSMSFQIDLAQSSTGYFVYKEIVSDGKKPCSVITFDKTDPTLNKVQVRGYSMCTYTPRQVERALEVQYQY